VSERGSKELDQTLSLAQDVKVKEGKEGIVIAGS